MNKSLTINFSEKTSSAAARSGRGSRWATIEQKYKSRAKEGATISDLHSMLALVKSGTSAYDYISGECPYASVNGDVITIKLDFYVWPSFLNLPYNLSTGSGTISHGIIITESRDFNIVFNGSSSEELPFIFNGHLTKEMPIISPDGTIIPHMIQVAAIGDVDVPHMVIDDSLVSLSQEVYTVFRAKGYARGYKHTITMELNKSWEANVESLTLNEFGKVDSLSRAYSAVNIVSSGGSYNYYEYPIEQRDGGILETWELRFINSSVFNLYNGNNDHKGSGTTTEDFVTEWFIIREKGWADTWEDGDYFRFKVIRSTLDNNPASNPTYKVVSMAQAGVGYNTNVCPIIHRGGAIEETWTIDFINSTVFNLKNSGGLSFGSGNINEDFVTDYFILESDGWYNTPDSDSYITFKVEKSGEIDRTGYKIENLENSIILSWVGDNGGIETETLELEIPPCVKDLLALCPVGTEGEGGTKWTSDVPEDKDRYRLDVYYNTCDGSKIKEEWIDTDDE